MSGSRSGRGAQCQGASPQSGAEASADAGPSANQRVTAPFLIENLETRILLSELLSTFAPTLPKVVRPADNPALPAEFDRFLPPGRTGRADAPAPDVAEWTKTGRPGDTIVVTADQLSTHTGGAAGSDTGFVVYGQTRLRRGVLIDAEVQKVDGQIAAIRLDDAPAGNPLPDNSMYFVWPKNASGYGDPLAVNRTEAWWVGPDRAGAGETISIFGRNLSHDGGETQSWVYVKPLGKVAGQWARVTTANPYKVDFVIPPELEPGTYEVWVHNGHGGNYGWAAPLTFAVRGDGKWTGTVYNVRNHGVKGDGVTDDYPAIAKLLEKAGNNPGSTIYFPAGTYRVSDGFRGTPDEIRWMGAGKGVTSIKPTHDYRKWGIMFDDIGANTEIRDITLDASTAASTQIFLLARPGNTHDVRFINVNFYGPSAELDMDLGSATRVVVRNADVVGRGIRVGTGKQVFIDGVNLYGTDDTDVLIWADGGSEISVTNSTARDYDNSNPNSGDGWAQGRFYAGQGLGASQTHIYLGGNSTYDLGVRPGVPDQNAGEQFMWELNRTQTTRKPTSATSKTVTFAALRALQGDRVTIVGGRGVGQYRRITSFDSRTGTIVVDRPWNVTPSPDSVISIGFLADRVVVYRNNIDGKVEQVTQASHTASSGVNMFGASVDFIVDGNLIKEVRHGIYNWMNEDGKEHHPFFSNLFVNNSIWNTRQGISIHAAGVGDGAVAYLGNVFRDNVVSKAQQHGFYMRSIGHGPDDANMNVVERNQFYHTPLGMRMDRHRGNMRNSVVQRNSFWRGDAPWLESYGCILFNVKDSLISANIFEWFQTAEAKWGELYL